jgi:Glycosyl transferase family 2
MRLVAISRVLDEADIIEAFVRHTAAFVDHHIFVDNGSKDGTIDILSSLQRDGISLTVFQNNCVSFNEAPHLTFMFREAITKHAADWVVCLDVDEFLDARACPVPIRTLLQHVEAMTPTLHGVFMRMVDYVATHDDVSTETVVPIRIRKRAEPSESYKVIARGGQDFVGLEITEGGHNVRLPGGQVLVGMNDYLRLAHYSERSPLQYILKFVRGWNRLLAAPADVAAKGHAYHYKAPYDVLRDRPGDFLRNPWFMGFKNERPGLVDDPIAYAGGSLRYTTVQDEEMRVVRALMGSVEALALRHGRLLSTFPEVRNRVAEWDAEFSKIL